MKFTLGQIIKAIEKDGYKRGKRAYFLEEEQSYCALGQASMNLTGNPILVGRALNEDNDFADFWNFVTITNDSTDLTLPEIAKKARTKFKGHLREYIEFD